MGTQVYKTISVAIAAMTIGGCTSTIHKQSDLDGIQTLSIDAKQRLVLVNKNGGANQMHRIVCAEPSPDALVAQAAALSANVNTPQKISAALGASNNETAGSIGLRTQTIQILRDGYFRVCEAYMNGSISQQEYTKIINNVDGAIAVVLAIDTLGGTVRAPTINLSPGATTITTDGEGGKVEANDSRILIESITAGSGGVDGKNAEAIKEIIIEYLRHMRARNNISDLAPRSS